MKPDECEQAADSTGRQPTITSIEGCLRPDCALAGVFEDEIAASRKLTVLVVEDDPAMRMFYGMALADTRYGTDLHFATDGWQGLLLASELRPQLILCDLNTPRVDGFGFLDALAEAYPELASAEVVAITGMSRNDIDARGGLPAGVQVLHKPLSMGALSRIVLNARERHLRATPMP